MKLDPMADDDAPNYMPTVQVIELLKAAGKAEQIRRRAALDYSQHLTRPDEPRLRRRNRGPRNFRRKPIFDSFMTTKHAALAYRDAKSDKVYTIDLQPSGDGFTVMAQNGRRGGTQTPQDKTPNGPIPYADAEKIFDKIVRTKLREGYQHANGSAPSPQVAPGIVSEIERIQLGVLMPELLEEISETDCSRLLLSPEYWMQDKSDGHSRGIVKRAGKISGINKTGQPVPLPAELVAELEQIDLASFQLDAELVGSRLICRDLTEAEGITPATPYKERFLRLVLLLAVGSDLISIVETWEGADNKAAAFNEQHKLNREGVVFKRIDAPYRPGKSGQHKKFKFIKTLSAIAGAPQQNGKNSVDVFLYASLADGAPPLVRCGTVSLNGKCIVQKGDILEIAYLYAHPSGLMSQARLLRKRDDVLPKECTTAQLILKADA